MQATVFKKYRCTHTYIVHMYKEIYVMAVYMVNMYGLGMIYMQ